MATTTTLYASELLGKGQNAEYFAGFDKEWWLYQIRNRRIWVQIVSTSTFSINETYQLPTLFIVTVSGATITLPSASDIKIDTGWNCYIKNNTTGPINVTSTSLIDGYNSPYILKPKNSLLCVSGGLNGWHLMDTTARYVMP